MLRFFGEKIEKLKNLGVNDIVLDPGFGFGKTIEQNYHIMKILSVFHELRCLLLVGISRKSMIYTPLTTTPDKALAGTIALKYDRYSAKCTHTQGSRCQRSCGYHKNHKNVFITNVMKKLFLFLGIILFLASCTPEDKYPIIPRIQFVSLDKIPNEYGFDYKANLSFYFEMAMVTSD